MTEFLFHFSAALVLPFWFLMIFMPRHAWTKKIIASPWIILPPVICYLLLLIPNLSIEYLGLFSEPSASNLAKIMAMPWAAAVFWAYAGAFDLFIGRWIYLDSQERGINHFLIAPILAIAIFFGPVGFFLYWILIFSRK